MTLRQAIKECLQLLTKRDRRILAFVTALQMATALLDLLGVFLIGIVTALAVSATSNGVMPVAIQSILEHFRLSGNDPLRLAVILAVAAGLLLITKTLINMFLTRRILQFLANRQALVSGRLTEGLLSLPILQVQQRSSQEISYALTNGVNFATLVIIGQAIVAVSEISLLSILAIGLFIVSPVVTVFTILFFLAVAVILQKLFAGWASDLGDRSTSAEVGSVAAIQEALRTYREVVVTNRRANYVSKIQALRWQAAEVQSDLSFLNLVPKYVFESALIVGAGLLAASQLLTRDLSAAVGVMAVFLAAGSRIVPSMLRLQGAALAVRSASGQAAPTLELAHELKRSLLRPEKSIGEQIFGNRQNANKESHEGFVPTIALESVSFRYPHSEHLTLDAISLNVPAGGSLAIVGPTGSGKSTLADVILGVLNIDSGSVEIGGVAPIEAIGRWPGGLAYVPQDVAMANSSIRQNVALGIPQDQINDKLVWEALERAHLAGALRGKRNGLETEIGEHGVQLSGGQRQRLGIARALYTRPLFLVMDEATSALDAETEQAVASMLSELEGSVTTVTVAHRLATIRHCDVVAYISGGKLISSGTFEEVRRSVPEFDGQARLLGL